MGERQTRGQVTENPECPCEGLGLPPVNSGSHQSKGGGGREQGGGTDQRAVFQSRSPKESQEDSGMERRGLVVSRGIESDSVLMARFVTSKMKKSHGSWSGRRKLLVPFLTFLCYISVCTI